VGLQRTRKRKGLIVRRVTPKFLKRQKESQDRRRETGKGNGSPAGEMAYSVEPSQLLWLTQDIPSGLGTGQNTPTRKLAQRKAFASQACGFYTFGKKNSDLGGRDDGGGTRTEKVAEQRKTLWRHSHIKPSERKCAGRFSYTEVENRCERLGCGGGGKGDRGGGEGTDRAWPVFFRVASCVAQ